MNRNLIYTFSFILYALIISCKKDNHTDIITPIHSASLHIIVVKPDSTFTNQPLSGVTIYLFLTDNDRSLNQNVKYTGTVNDSGKISFTSLHDNYYYLLASHPTLGTKKSETATPDKSVSYEEIDY